jgi:hypothetical protein
MQRSQSPTVADGGAVIQGTRFCLCPGVHLIRASVCEVFVNYDWQTHLRTLAVSKTGHRRTNATKLENDAWWRCTRNWKLKYSSMTRYDYSHAGCAMRQRVAASKWVIGNGRRLGGLSILAAYPNGMIPERSQCRSALRPSCLGYCVIPRKEVRSARTRSRHPSGVA